MLYTKQNSHTLSKPSDFSAYVITENSEYLSAATVKILFLHSTSLSQKTYSQRQVKDSGSMCDSSNL